MRAFFTLVCGRHENGVGKFRIFWDFWELWGWVERFWVGAGAKNFWVFWVFGVKTKFFEFFGKFEFFGFQKGCRSLHILFEM